MSQPPRANRAHDRHQVRLDPVHLHLLSAVVGERTFLEVIKAAASV